MKTRDRMKRTHKNKKTQKFRHNKTLKKLNCSPKPKGYMNNFTCYTNRGLIRLRDKWNSKHPNDKITTNDPKHIHSLLTEKLKHTCKTESCWLKQKKAFGHVEGDLAESFAPESPPEWKSNPNEWLSSTDIIRVMKQYERAYKCFDFIGPTPINFDTKKMYGQCVWEELCNFSLEKMIKKGIFKIGIIFNTDPDTKPGQHWISMFINIKKKTIFFFDSVGDKPQKEIKNLIERIKTQGDNLKKPIHFKVDSNEGIEHQYGNTECGMYSLYFIIRMLMGDSFRPFCRREPPDAAMLDFRDWLFST